MIRIPTVLLNPAPPLWRYCFKAYLIGLAPMIFIILVAVLPHLFFGAPLPNVGQHIPLTVKRVLVVVLGAPLLETLFLALFVKLARKVTARLWLAALLSALAFSALHLSNNTMNAISVIPMFFVQSCAYMAWRERSFAHGYWAAAIIHCLNNSITIALVFILLALAGAANAT